MRQGATISGAMHLATIVMIAAGLPSLVRDPIDVDPPILLELVAVQEKSQAPTPVQPPAPKQDLKATEPPPPTTQAPATSQPDTPKAQEPDPPKVTQPEPPKPKEPEPIKPVEAPKDAEPIKKVEEKKEEPKKPEPPKPKPVEVKKPEPPKPDPFQSVLKNVDKLRAPAPQRPNQQQAKLPPQPAPPTASRLSDQLARSELDAVRERIRPCWNFPAGAPNPERLIVDVWVSMNPDGTVREARIVDTSRMGDPFYRAAAEAALRAMLNPACQPLPLPRDKYSFWKTSVFGFDPRDL